MLRLERRNGVIVNADTGVVQKDYCRECRQYVRIVDIPNLDNPEHARWYFIFECRHESP
jgi:hypothetical protein